MNDMRYRIRVALLGASVLVAISSAAHAQQWPSKPIRWLVPVAAGGATDVVARLLQEPVGKLLGGTIVVENRPGGAGVIATQATVTSPPDGYTMALIYTSHPANAVMQPKLPYDSFKDITPVAFFWRAQLAFSVRTDSPLKSLQDLLEAARRDPGSITYGTGGVGTGAHIAGAMFAEAAQVKLTHAPYRGAAPALNDLLAGQLPVLISNVSALPPHIETGRLRPLAVTGAKRSPVLPDVPTVAELGFPGYQATEWSGLIGPANVPAEIVTRMNQAVNAAIGQPAVVEEYRKMGLETVLMSPGEFKAFLEAETSKFADVIRKGGIKSE
jgi:tripartite-type tricarboxylate transporter receptor subunit TctC